MTLPRFNGYPVRGFLRAPASVAAANVVVLFHPTIEEEGTTPLDAATRFMNLATDSSKLNIAGTNIIFACELTRAITVKPTHPQFIFSLLSIPSHNYRYHWSMHVKPSTFPCLTYLTRRRFACRRLPPRRHSRLDCTAGASAVLPPIPLKITPSFFY